MKTTNTLNTVPAQGSRHFTPAETRHIMIELADERIRLRRALDQIGFKLAGTEHEEISRRCIAVLRGETFDGLPIPSHHFV